MILSIIIPARNEEGAIEKCINHIYDNDLPSDVVLEVFVVDGLSSDGTVDKVEQLKTKYPSLSILLNENQTTPSAFNIGIKNANGDYIQIVGARQFLSKNYLSETLNSFSLDEKIRCVGGGVENVFLNEKSKIIALAMDSPFGVGGGNFRIAKKSGFVDTVGTPMYPKSVFEEFGLFDEKLVRNQDDEYNYRITASGYKIYQNKDAVIQYMVRASFGNLKKQYYQYGYWKVYVNKKVKTITTIRQLFPFALVSYTFIGLIISLFNFYIAFAFSISMILYIALSIFFAVKKSVKPREILIITWTFWILHYSYGIGYLKGVIDFFLLSKGPNSRNASLSR